MLSVVVATVRGRAYNTVRCITLAAILVTAGCGTQSTPETSGTSSEQSSEDLQRAAEGQCITTAFNEAVLSPQNVKATLDSMMGQSLDGCPNDFTSSFVKLRVAVRNYAQTLAEIEAHNQDQNAAVGRDAINLACSLFSGEQCAPSSIQGWVDADDSLKAQDAANRAAIQSAYDELEAVAAQHGVYVRTTEPSSTPSAPPPDATDRAE